MPQPDKFTYFRKREFEKNSFSRLFGAVLYIFFLFVLHFFMEPYISYCDGGQSAFTPSPSPPPGEEPALPQEAPPIPQQVLVPELPNPLIPDMERRQELYRRSLIHGFFRPDRTLRESMQVVEYQLQIERWVEAALVGDGFAPASILYNLNLIRGFIFYPFGDLLTEQTYARYVAQIESNGTRESLPYRRVRRAISNYEIWM